MAMEQMEPMKTMALRHLTGRKHILDINSYDYKADQLKYD